MTTVVDKWSGYARRSAVAPPGHLPTAPTPLRRTRPTPLDWAVTQMRLGVALATLGERESGTVRLEQAIVAWDNCLTVAGSLLPPEWVDEMRADEVQTRTEIKERQAK